MQIHYSSKTNEWATPWPVFDTLEEKFGRFSLDPCAQPHNTKCGLFFTPEEDGLTRSWTNHSVFMNPPYGRVIGKWLQKAAESSQAGAFVVALVPARTDTRYWHKYVMGQATDVYLVKGRIKFLGADGTNHPAPFPSAVVVYQPFVLYYRTRFDSLTITRKRSVFDFPQTPY